METTQTTSRIHPLLAGAAVSVTLVSLLGVAALSGMLPNSNSSGAPLAQTTPAPAPVLVQTQAGLQYMQPVSAPIAAAYQVEPVTPPAHKHAATVRRTSSHQTTYAQNENNYRNDNRQPAYQQPNYQQPVQAANSPIGIATGAVVGGLIGNQVGGGRGRTLATVAGAVGGGFLGNMAGQKYGY
ncbi:glycine zipper 2TM domain-containing protein [Actimicrobium sp. CCC2.4]|uniref:glycine zipper 2TM domain-containing protein n=1 Tax=Actimicrobium sp. CCC2.4 TaxID=3048606 RepID=UPI002AC8EBAC|nr:glycine zipper 2TM domain-containing protein [Actimicrobium sp. CCC2.4]MEB0135953.1 glycine zipper 2TM domain-containing protein [Actimicrobium sp. CCC2.4]WPX32617.1 glycine zipper 2TM domain-containing protein [Actimicrobium sp. CCC2.4]